MSNPAALLHALFTEWNKPSKPADGARGGDTLETWEKHRIAVLHLEAINELLTKMEAEGRSGLGAPRAAFAEWNKIVFVHPQGWGAANSGGIGGTTMAQLEAFAGRLEDISPQLKPDGLQTTQAFVDEVRATLAEDNSIPKDLRVHLTYLVDHLNWCLTKYAEVGDFELTRATERLLITLGAAAQKSDDPSRWTTVVNNWVSPFVVGVSANMLSTGAMTMLMPGSQ